MLNALKAFVVAILTPLLQWISERTIVALKDYFARRKAEQDALAESARIKAETEVANTPEEREHAADDNRRHF